MATTWQARIARQERDAAEAEKTKAESINKFLQEMLSFSNQSWSSTAGQKRDVTINEMLDDIAPRLETELADQPEVRARMYSTIAGAYHSQGRFPLAEKYLRDALVVVKRENYLDFLGYEALNQGDQLKDIKYFQSYLAYDPTNETVSLDLASIYKNNCLYEKSEETIKLSLQAYPDNSEAKVLMKEVEYEKSKR